MSPTPLVNLHDTSLALKSLTNQAVYHAPTMLTKCGASEGTPREDMCHRNLSPILRRQVRAVRRHSGMAPLVHDAGAPLALITLLADAPYKSMAMRAEGGLPQKGCHKCMTINGMNLSSSGRLLGSQLWLS